jgi:hypothetical protein
MRFEIEQCGPITREQNRQIYIRLKQDAFKLNVALFINLFPRPLLKSVNTTDGLQHNPLRLMSWTPNVNEQWLMLFYEK